MIYLRAILQIGMHSVLRLRSWKTTTGAGIRRSQLPIASVQSLFRIFLSNTEVPCTVARMLKRPLRVHIVGAEERISWTLKEVAYLLEDFAIELMVPLFVRTCSSCVGRATKVICI
jgi:hypothetical protein